MCPVSRLLHGQAQEACAIAAVREKVPERATRLRCSELVLLTAFGALVVLTSGAMAQQREVSTTIFSSGLHGAVPAPAQSTETFTRRTAAEAGFDTAGLPPIESIDAGGDIRPFLAPGVPADLTRAALRRAWPTDPAIRDFIGPSENSWDFNAPGGIAGFASMTTGDTRRALLKETASSDPERLAARPSTHDQVPGVTGDTLRPPGSVPIE